MRKAILIISLVEVGACGALGIAICRGLGVQPHVQEMLIAAGICLLAAELALLPIWFQRTADRAGQAQAVFLGTVIHLMSIMVLAIVAMLTMHPSMSFIYWLLAMYWVTLIGLCAVFIRIVRSPIGSMTTGKP